MKVINKIYQINAPIEKVWDALVNPSTINKWGGGPVKMSQDEGFGFEFWGGDIFGTNTKVVKNKALEQDWYGGKWEKPSKVKFELSEKDGKTELILVHKYLPEAEADDFDKGWDDYYLGPIKQLLES